MEIDKIYLDQRIKNHEFVREILGRLKRIPVEMVEDAEKFSEQTRDWSLTSGKKKLWLTRSQGRWTRPCPGTGSPYLCCNYWFIHALSNCPLECSYCVLQGYLNSPVLTVFCNIEDIGVDLANLTQHQPSRVFRIGTGELTDSLALDPWLRLNERLISMATQNNVILEFKTKTVYVEHLPVLKKSNVVISWSINPEVAIRRFEFKTAPFKVRFSAARRVLQKGYRIGFHFDPILDYPDHEKDYQVLIERMLESFSEKEIAWISLGSLRIPAAYRRVMEERFPKVGLFSSSEMIQGLDGKLRYFRPNRIQTYRGIYEQIRGTWKDVFIYFCMENDVVWRQVAGDAPESNEHFDYLFHENLYKRFPDLDLPMPQRDLYDSECEFENTACSK